MYYARIQASTVIQSSQTGWGFSQRLHRFLTIQEPTFLPQKPQALFGDDEELSFLAVGPAAAAAMDATAVLFPCRRNRTSDFKRLHSKHP